MGSVIDSLGIISLVNEQMMYDQCSTGNKASVKPTNHPDLYLVGGWLGAGLMRNQSSKNGNNQPSHLLVGGLGATQEMPRPTIALSLTWPEAAHLLFSLRSIHLADPICRIRFEPSSTLLSSTP